MSCRRNLYRKRKSDLSIDNHEEAASVLDETKGDRSIIAKSVFSDEEFPSSDGDSVDLNVLERGSSAEQLENSIHQAIKRTIKRFSNSSAQKENDLNIEEDQKYRDTDNSFDHSNVVLNRHHEKHHFMADSSDKELEKNKENIENDNPNVATSSVEGGSSQNSTTPLFRRLQRKRRIIYISDDSDNETPLKKPKSEHTSYPTSPEYLPPRVLKSKYEKTDITTGIKNPEIITETPVHYISKAGGSKDRPLKSFFSARLDEDKKMEFLNKAVKAEIESDDSSDDIMDNAVSQNEISVSYMQATDSKHYEETFTSSEVSVTSEDDGNDSDYVPDDSESQKDHLINQKRKIEKKVKTTKNLLKMATADSQFKEARRYQQTIDAEEKKLSEITENLDNFDFEQLWNQLYSTTQKKKLPKGGSLFKDNSSEIDPVYLTPKLEDGAKKLGKQAQETLYREQSLTVERLQDLHGSLVARPVENQRAQDPKGLKVPLMPHQKHALAWLQWREKQNPRGGVLADEMGLGKTLTMIALVMASIAKDNDGEDSEDEEEWKTSARGQKYLGGTLVVVPVSLLAQWEGEVKTRCKRNFVKVEVYHGTKRETAPRRLAKNDIVLTTYNIVCREYKMCSLLFKIRWRRVILDEAHVIRNHKSQPCQSVCALSTNKRWAVTGTPLHNKEMDLYSLLKFLQCSPFDDVRVWKRWVDNRNDAGHERLATVMKTLMLRRTKLELQEKGELPPLPQKTVKTIEVALDPEERLVYDKVMLYSRSLFAQFLTQRAEKAARGFQFDSGGGYEKLRWNYRGRTFTKKQNQLLSLHADVQAHEILVLLIRLRQVCCHPSLIGAMLDRDDIELQAGIELFPALDKPNELEKSKRQKKNDITVEDEIDNEDEQDFEVDERVTEHLLTSDNPVFAPDRQSSKMRAVISKVEEVLDSDDKIIVVSQWVGVLNIVAKELDLISGASYRMFTGQVAVKDRQKILDDFNSERENPNVLLLSLNAGGVGLNVVGANHMLLVDIHWNPQLESQVQDRIHRFGQTKNVTVYKYICSDTVEERIQALQNKKLELARQILTGTGKVVGSKLSLDDIKSLFGV